MAREIVTDLLPDLVVVLLVPAPELGVYRVVAERDGVVGGTLEDGEVIRLLGDLRGDLDAGSTRADDPDLLAEEVDALVGPLGGVVPIAGKVLHAGNVRQVRR